jgi:hypothetical protein
MEDEEHVHRDSHFQEELDSLKINMARITNLVEKMLKKISSEGSSNRPMTFVKTQAAI